MTSAIPDYDEYGEYLYDYTIPDADFSKDDRNRRRGSRKSKVKMKPTTHRFVTRYMEDYNDVIRKKSSAAPAKVDTKGHHVFDGVVEPPRAANKSSQATTNQQSRPALVPKRPAPPPPRERAQVPELPPLKPETRAAVRASKDARDLAKVLVFVHNRSPDATLTPEVLDRVLGKVGGLAYYLGTRDKEFADKVPLRAFLEFGRLVAPGYNVEPPEAAYLGLDDILIALAGPHKKPSDRVKASLLRNLNAQLPDEWIGRSNLQLGADRKKSFKELNDAIPSDPYKRAAALSRMPKSWIKMLLVMQGIEPNPGPPQKAVIVKLGKFVFPSDLDVAGEVQLPEKFSYSDRPEDVIDLAEAYRSFASEAAAISFCRGLKYLPDSVHAALDLGVLPCTALLSYYTCTPRLVLSFYYTLTRHLSYPGAISFIVECQHHSADLKPSDTEWALVRAKEKDSSTMDAYLTAYAVQGHPQWPDFTPKSRPPAPPPPAPEPQDLAKLEWPKRKLRIIRPPTYQDRNSAVVTRAGLPIEAVEVKPQAAPAAPVITSPEPDRGREPPLPTQPAPFPPPDARPVSDQRVDVEPVPVPVPLPPSGPAPSPPVPPDPASAPPSPREPPPPPPPGEDPHSDDDDEDAPSSDVWLSENSDVHSHVPRAAYFNGIFRGKESSFNSVDPVVHVRMEGREWHSDAAPEMPVVYVPGRAVLLAARVGPSGNQEQRYSALCNLLGTDWTLNQEMSGWSEDECTRFAMQKQLLAFLLVGVVSSVGSLRVIPGVDGMVVEKYHCPRVSEADARRVRARAHVNNDLVDNLYADNACARSAPIYLDGFNAYLPSTSDPNNIIACLAKRILPEPLPVSTAVKEELCRLSLDLVNYINLVCASQEAPTKDDLFANAVKDRPARVREQFEKGANLWRDDPTAAITRVATEKYKAFYKREILPFGSLKPPRLIMSLPEQCRGIQIMALCVALWKIDVGTRECNVKHLTPDEIREKLKAKFARAVVAYETDYSSFESCITPEIKGCIENLIFSRLCTEADEVEFIHRVLERKTVTVLGRGFDIPKCPHIRMSGDYWTSLGNLVTNLVVSAYVLNKPIDWTVKHCLFEGDDGVLPAAVPMEFIEDRAVKCGMRLKISRAPWYQLSFCGNHFELAEGGLRLVRDPQKVIAQLCTLIGPSPNSHRDDLTLQRSKCLSVLAGPWIRDASAFAAVVERATARYVVVTRQFLISHDLLGEYKPYSPEGCIPDFLKTPDDAEWAELVSYMDTSAGGSVTEDELLDMLAQARRVVKTGEFVAVESPFVAPPADTALLYQEGLYRRYFRPAKPLDLPTVHDFKIVPENPDGYVIHKGRVIYPRQVEEGSWFWFIFYLVALILLFLCFTRGQNVLLKISELIGVRVFHEPPLSAAVVPFQPRPLFPGVYDIVPKHDDITLNPFFMFMAPFVTALMLSVVLVVRRCRRAQREF